MRFGVKAHWRDADAMAGIAREAGARLLEVHLAPRDLGADRGRVREAFLPLRREFDLAVHQPEWVDDGRGTWFLDPSARDASVRKASVAALASTLDLAAELRAEAVVLHFGALALPGREPSGDLAGLRRSLAELPRGVPRYLENMPWFYGLSPGVWGTTTLGRTPAELDACADLVDGFVLDFCHAFLGARGGDGLARVDAFVAALGRRIRHAHVSDARIMPDGEDPRRGEGVPFGEGGLSAAAVMARVPRLHPDAAVVPEVFDGHLQGGAAFREALAALRATRVGLPGDAA